MSTAATILLTQHIGAGRVGEECSEIVTVAVTVSAVFSFLVGLFLLLEPELVFQLLRTPEDAFDGACLYTRIVGGTVLLQGLYIQLCAVLRSYTLLKEVVALSVSMNLLNVAGNAILINGFFGFPQMGVAGAAVSTVISKAVGLTLACITLKRKCTVRFSLQYLHPFPAKTFRALLGIALPSGTEALSYNVSQTFILRFINLMGAAVVSAKVYGSMLANVAYVYSIAVGQATQIILGYMIGGRKLDEVSGRVWSTIRIALAAEEPGGVFGQAENIRGSRKFEVGQQSPTVIEHGPIAVGESMRREVVVMRLLHIGCLLEQSHLARAAGLSGKAFLREHIAPPFLFEPGIHGEIFPVAVF